MRYNWTFDRGVDGFGYQDDTFLFTTQPRYASGAHTTSGGFSGGALQVRLGGVDDTAVFGMSGGWNKSFTLTEAQKVTLTFRYKIDQGRDYEANEYTDLMAALDGKLLQLGGSDHLARIYGDGNGGAVRTTGWKTVTIDLGELDAGAHTLRLGGFSNAKSTLSERTTLSFDDVTVETAPVVGATPGGTTGATGGNAPALDAFEARVLELVNEYRAQNGKAPLANDAKLNAAAEDWSKDMAYGDFFKHSSPAQVEEHDYEWRAWGENIAAGQRTPEAVMSSWINSPGHRANILSDKFQEIGIGYHYLEDDTGSVNYRHYWTQVFGTEMDAIA